MSEELKNIEKEYKNFYEKIEYIDENTIYMHIKIDDNKDKISNLKDNYLNLYIKFHSNYFEVLNENLNGEKKFDCMEQIFNTFCPFTFKKYIIKNIKHKLNSDL
ncbi:conserved Plasmodium protein, unknown function [Plasmodium gallinaceum]|uniref:Uncharacterized protein n=1 Tax=Plasmodium gallinaceum TaxID=5849 RepID=A0A1J1GWH7_PLAGA|nr:conserved Plasmodium protein, unknown function [Plasmodium gallinaceum]CRG96615.1 conserved Plasmodium protein, unknown function [Plasmodium gallinaceum]